MFDPGQVESFRYLGYSFDRATGTAEFHYGFDDSHRFTEIFRFPVTTPVADDHHDRSIDRLLRLLWLAAGVSYYKAAIPPTVSIEGPITTAEVRWLHELIFEGLGEFAYVNQVSLQDRPRFDAEETEQEPSPANFGSRTMVAVGGGKDSCVSIEAVRRSDADTVLAAIGTPRAIVDVIAVAGLPSVTLKRSLSPELFRLNQEGALNGHIPVTAVVSLALMVAAGLNDCSTVIMSNERSASIGNTEWDGREVNHQWSKSLVAERSLAAVVEAAVGPSMTYFSLLRPLSELDIARRFSTLTQYHPVFTSCNRAFHIDESLRIDRWCTDCPKCRFVFLILAPFMDPGALVAIFGRDLLDDPAQEAGFDALLGWNAFKPFECVGEVEESVAAMGLLLEAPAWKDHHIVRRFGEEIAPNIAIPPGLAEKFLTPSDDHDVPAAYLEALHATG